MGKSFPFSSVPARRCACPRPPFAPSDSLGGGYARPSCVLPWHSTCSLATSQATWLGASLPTEPLTSSRDLQTPSPGSPRHFSTPPGTCPELALWCEASAFSPVARGTGIPACAPFNSRARPQNCHSSPATFAGEESAFGSTATPGCAQRQRHLGAQFGHAPIPGGFSFAFRGTGIPACALFPNPTCGRS